MQTYPGELSQKKISEESINRRVAIREAIVEARDHGQVFIISH